MIRSASSDVNASAWERETESIPRNWPPGARGATTRDRSPGPGQFLLLRVLRIRVHVTANDRLRLARYVLEDGARHRPRRSAGIKALCLEAGVGHDDGLVSIDEDDRQALELEDPAELAEEAVERLLLLERGGESARDSVDGLELVGPAPKLVAQLLRLFGTRVGNGRLAPKPRREPADEEAHEHLEAERERDGVQVEVAVVTVGTKHLPVRQERRKEERDDEAARDAEADSAFRDRQEERLPDRRVRLPGVEDDHEGTHDGDVERQREYASTLWLRGESSRRAISQMTPAPAASAPVTIQAQRS